MGFFQFFRPSVLDRRGVICCYHVLQLCNQQGGDKMAKRFCHKCLREFEPTGELPLCQPCIEKYPNAVDEALEELVLERKGRLFGNPDSPLYHIHAGLDRDGEPIGW